MNRTRSLWWYICCCSHCTFPLILLHLLLLLFTFDLTRFTPHIYFHFVVVTFRTYAHLFSFVLCALYVRLSFDLPIFIHSFSFTHTTFVTFAFLFYVHTPHICCCYFVDLTFTLPHSFYLSFYICGFRKVSLKFHFALPHLISYRCLFRFRCYVDFRCRCPWDMVVVLTQRLRFTFTIVYTPPHLYDVWSRSLCNREGVWTLSHLSTHTLICISSSRCTFLSDIDALIVHLHLFTLHFVTISLPPICDHLFRCVCVWWVEHWHHSLFPFTSSFYLWVPALRSWRRTEHYFTFIYYPLFITLHLIPPPLFILLPHCWPHT